MQTEVAVHAAPTHNRGVNPSTVRYAPDRALPLYAFLPGRDPHPTRDARGHSFGAPESPVEYLPPDRWRENEEYLFGVDLYNHGFLWEAHEAWESLWHRSKHDAVQADFLQGLIQCSAASLKIPMEQPAGLKKLSEAGTRRLESAAERAGPHYMGLDVWEFIHEFRAFAASEPASADERPRIVLA
jgi:hypothetical protein